MAERARSGAGQECLATRCSHRKRRPSDGAAQQRLANDYVMMSRKGRTVFERGQFFHSFLLHRVVGQWNVAWLGTYFRHVFGIFDISCY